MTRPPALEQARRSGDQRVQSAPALSTASTAAAALASSVAALGMCVCGEPAVHDPRAPPEFLLECHYCAHWFHGRCVRVNEVDAMEIVKFACGACAKQGHATLKYQDAAALVDVDDLSYAPLPIQRRGFSPYATMHDAYGTTGHSNQHTNQPPPPQYAFASYKKNSDAFRRALRAALFARSGVRVVAAHEFTPAYFKFHSLHEPVLVLDSSNGASNNSNTHSSGNRARLPVIGVQDVGALVSGGACLVRSLDVGSQESFALSPTGWNARLSHPSPDAPLNAQFRVLETAFRHEITALAAVAQIDWHYTLPSATGASTRAPNPELFGTLCDAHTFYDFTVAPDCRATWLTVSNGELSVFLIEPTSAHLAAFCEWKAPSNKGPPPPTSVFLADRVDRCIKCSVKTASTLVIPSGWIHAIYADHGSSFFSGTFTTTLALGTQLAVWRALEESDERVVRAWKETSFPHGWALQPSPTLAPSAPLNAQLWSMVCHYINELSHQPSQLHGGTTVGAQECDALRRSLSALRLWGATARAIARQDNVSWLPSSQQDAESLLDQLEQAIASMPAAAASAPMSATSSASGTTVTSPLISSGKMSGLASLSANEASYLYTAAAMAGSAQDVDDVWNTSSNVAVSAAHAFSNGHSSYQPSTGATSGTTGSNDAASLWEYPAYHQQPNAHAHALDPLVVSAAPQPSSYFHPQLADNNHFGGALQNAYVIGGQQSAASVFGGYLDPMRPGNGASPSSVGHQLGLLGPHGHPLMDVSNNVGQFSDVLVRHRASCHRCGNLRKKNVRCPKCPHIFCQKCAEKMVEEHGESVFVDGCPVCKELCCCGKNRTMMCTRKFHCYKKCPATKRPSS